MEWDTLLRVPTLCLCLPDLLQDLAAEMNSISVRFPDAAWIAMVTITIRFHWLPVVTGVSDVGPEDFTIEILRQRQKRPQGFEM